MFPGFGVGTGNVIFDGAGENEDFGAEQTTGDASLRYMFRTAPLRNLAAALAFFHNRAFIHWRRGLRTTWTCCARRGVTILTPIVCPMDLFIGPIEPVLAAGIDPLVAKPTVLTRREFKQLVNFVRMRF